MEARVNITYNGQNGDLPDPVNFDATDAEIIGWATEAIRSGGVPGISTVPDADLQDFVVDRFQANDDYPVPRLMVRPKTPFGV
jgi:hypothetical protein